MERHEELVGRHNEHIEQNPTSTSNNYTNLYIDHIANTPDTNYTLLTV